MDDWMMPMKARLRKLFITYLVVAIFILVGTIYLMITKKVSLGILTLFFFAGCLVYAYNNYLTLLSVFSRRMDKIVWVYLKETNWEYNSRPQMSNKTYEVIFALTSGKRCEFNLPNNHDEGAVTELVQKIREAVPWALVGPYSEELDDVFKENPYLFRLKYGTEPDTYKT